MNRTDSYDARLELVDKLSKLVAEHADELDASEAAGLAAVAAPILADRGKIDIVLDGHLDTQSRPQRGANVQRIEAGDIGRKDDAARLGIDDPRTPHHGAAQPLMRPLIEGKTVGQVLAGLDGTVDATSRELLEAHWTASPGGTETWQRSQPSMWVSNSRRSAGDSEPRTYAASQSA